MDEDAEQSDFPQAASKPENLDNIFEKQAEASILPATQPQLKQESKLVQQLKAIANSLSQLETTLAADLQPANPLWYMDVLEKTIANN